MNLQYRCIKISRVSHLTWDSTFIQMYVKNKNRKWQRILNVEKKNGILDICFLFFTDTTSPGLSMKPLDQ